MQPLNFLYRNFCLYLGIPPRQLVAFEPKIKTRLELAIPWVYSPPSENDRSGQFLVPRLDRLYEAIQKEFGLPRTPLWPGGSPYAVCITHDVDRILSSLHAFKREKNLEGLSQSIRDSWAILTNRWNENSYFNFESILDFQYQNRLPTTLYVLFEKRRIRKSVIEREIQHTIGVYSPFTIENELKDFQSRGNEIGLHTSFDGYNNELQLRSERESLLSMNLKNIIGVRNHYLFFEDPLTEELQSNVGFKYDSTMGFNFQNGFRLGTSFPIVRHDILEIPLLLMDTALRCQTFSPKVVDQIGTEVNRANGVLMLNWHFHTMNHEIFPTEMEILQNLVTKARKEGAFFCCPSEVYRLWRQRFENLFPENLTRENRLPMDEKGSFSFETEREA